MAGSGPLTVRLPDGGTSNITPTYSVPNTSGLYQEASEAAARLVGAAQGALAVRAKKEGAKAGDELKKRPNAMERVGDLVLTDGAYTAAYNTAALARLKSDVDNHDAILRARHRYDVEGYEKASAAAQSGFVQGAPENLAVEVETYARQRFRNGYAAVAIAAEERATQEAAQAIGMRIKSLDDTLLGLAASGQIDSLDFERADAERALLQVERARNPAILYSDAARAADDDKLYDGLHGAAAAHSAVLAYGEAGGGLPGRAAAYRLLENEVLNGDAFKDVSPDRKTGIYRDAKRQIDEFSKADIEQQREQEAAEREARIEMRDKVGSIRLQVMLGETSEAQIRAMEDIPDDQKASLIAGARAQARRERAEARAGAALAKAGEAAMYREFSDSAAAGTLSEAEIADGLRAGYIRPGQAQTLRAKRDKALAPVVEDVMAPVKDAGNRPGRRASAEKLAIAEEQAAAWARQNPQATLDEKLKAGRAISERVFGATKAPAPGANAGVARQGQINALKAQLAANKISRAQYNARLKEIVNGR